MQRMYVIKVYLTSRFHQKSRPQEHTRIATHILGT